VEHIDPGIQDGAGMEHAAGAVGHSDAGVLGLLIDQAGFSVSIFFSISSNFVVVFQLRMVMDL